jgi:hypothetical protein
MKSVEDMKNTDSTEPSAEPKPWPPRFADYGIEKYDVKGKRFEEVSTRHFDTIRSRAKRG